MNTFTPEKFMAHCFRVHGTLTRAAKVFGVSRTMVSLVANGRRLPTAAMLRDMGIVAPWSVKEAA